jgi:hypothetical protein
MKQNWTSLDSSIQYKEDVMEIKISYHALVFQFVQKSAE